MPKRRCRDDKCRDVPQRETFNNVPELYGLMTTILMLVISSTANPTPSPPRPLLLLPPYGMWSPRENDRALTRTVGWRILPSPFPPISPFAPSETASLIQLSARFASASSIIGPTSQSLSRGFPTLSFAVVSTNRFVNSLAIDLCTESRCRELQTWPELAHPPTRP